MLFIVIIIILLSILVYFVSGCVRPNPKTKITSLVDKFANGHGYYFGSNKDHVIETLVTQYNLYGNFYCPCRVEHTKDTVCPCKPTREGEVVKEGKCLCGLFWKEPQPVFHYWINPELLS